MENQDMLKLTIGTEEKAEKLKPMPVTIMSIEVIEVGNKKAKKLSCSCKHPDAPDEIKISSVKYEVKGKLDTVGLWVNLNKEKTAIVSNSALAVFLQAEGCKTPDQLVGKTIMTCQDDKGYLVFKGY